jgi:hypothetical protein
MLYKTFHKTPDVLLAASGNTAVAAMPDAPPDTTQNHNIHKKRKRAATAAKEALPASL